MRVLGIDIGIAITGWAIAETSKSAINGVKLVDFGAVITDTSLTTAARLKVVHDDISSLIREYKPEQLAIESLFYFKNQKTIINVSQARGVVLLAGQENDLSIFDYTPLQVKTACTGYGRADKRQMQKTIQLMFKLAKLPKPDDIADAIAICVCHLNTNRIVEK
jgi:crossover junction endodeoxyribonuclease RuvC